jgi:pyruvate/2-oxoglutarate dehydrogenase complex dihydrolipoamide acyltransferase (E2) component
VEECLLVKWWKQKGDRVAEGRAIADIQTDKAAFEIAAPAAGISVSGSRSMASWNC